MFGIGVVVSHYSTTYMMLMGLVISLVVIQAMMTVSMMESNPKMEVPKNLLFKLCCFTFCLWGRASQLRYGIRCKIWLNPDNPDELMVRGYWAFVYRTQTWQRVEG